MRGRPKKRIKGHAEKTKLEKRTIKCGVKQSEKKRKNEKTKERKDEKYEEKKDTCFDEIEEREEVGV